MSARRDFLLKLFHGLNERGISYCVLRNYEQLYEGGSSDVDLLVAAPALGPMAEILAAAAKAGGYQLAQRIRHICFSWVFWRPAEGFLRIDVQCEVRWRVFPVLSANEILSLRRKQPDFYIPHPKHESVILFLAAMSRAELSDRYRQQLARLYAQLSDPEELADSLRKAFGRIGGELAKCQKSLLNDLPAANSPASMKVEGEMPPHPSPLPLGGGEGESSADFVANPDSGVQRAKQVRRNPADGPSTRGLWPVRRSLIRKALVRPKSFLAMLGYVAQDAKRLWLRLRHPPGISVVCAVTAERSSQSGLECGDMSPFSSTRHVASFQSADMSAHSKTPSALLNLFLDSVDFLFPRARLAVQSFQIPTNGAANLPGLGLRLRWQRIKTLIKGGICVRSYQVPGDGDLRRAIRAHTDLLYASRTFIWTSDSLSRTYVQHVGTGFMGELGPEEDSGASAGQPLRVLTEFVVNALRKSERVEGWE
ncbi:MAG: hypothetical protein C5B50_08960 [Verrucomicrobia bacterium]|nr:MAG: hypothetical protein C5B50_08960 [Verrucomicrobiota bacterium]